MSEQRQFFQQSFHYFGGRLALMLLGFVSFPIFTRVFSVSDYGIMALITNLLLVFTVFAKFGLQNSVQRFHHEHANSPDLDSLRRFYSSLLSGNFFLGAITVSVFVVAVWLAPISFLSLPSKKLLYLAAWVICLRAERAMVGNLLLIEKRTLYFNVLEIANKMLVLLAICLLLYFWKRTLTSFFLGTLLAELVTILALIPYLVKRKLLSFKTVDASVFGEAARFSFPLLWAELAWVILDSGDRFLVLGIVGSEALGLYVAAYSIASYVQDLLITPVNLALAPACMSIYASEGVEETKRFLSDSFINFCTVAIAVVCIFSVTSNEIITILASKKYQNARGLLPILVIGLVFSSLQGFFRIGLFIDRKPSEVAKATGIAGGFNILLNIVLLPAIGVKGAAIATLVSYVIWVVVTAYISRISFPFEIQYITLSRLLVAAGTALYVTSFLRFESYWTGFLLKSTFLLLVYSSVLLLIDKRTRHLIKQLVKGRYNIFAMAAIHKNVQ